MSALKYQLKALLPSLSAEANENQDPAVKRRLYLIRAVCSSPKSVKTVCESRGVSTDLFYKWALKLLGAKSLSGLSSLSKAPKKFWNKTPKRIEKRVIALRKQYPFKGPETISRELKKKFNIVCAVSTVGAILKRAGLISKTYQERLNKKHMKRYRRPLPGYMQLDIKYVPYPVESRKLYQFSAVDHHSSWRCIRIYEDRSLVSVIDFLNELERRAPFPIIEIQTDNATEFTDKFSSKAGLRPTSFHAFDRWCKERDIHHRLIPIGQKELNGKVENSHRFDDREFYSQLKEVSITNIKQAAKVYNHRWNEERETKTLGWKTPSKVVAEAYPRAIAFINFMRARWRQEKITVERSQAGYVINPPAKKKTKKTTTVDRYLEYLDWETKKGYRSFIPMPTMFQVFS